MFFSPFKNCNIQVNSKPNPLPAPLVSLDFICEFIHLGRLYTPALITAAPSPEAQPSGWSLAGEHPCAQRLYRSHRHYQQHDCSVRIQNRLRYCTQSSTGQN
ncbi:hypothetical protein KIL84_002289 [Mauremys mutica]|uniref:Uncharacterized protein n=1 Tax=Mauremys mutica TaxID=74926 RepID=A0A9D3X7J8_9SAUR|nr:hypothetical protein KIL84_002289 [Mauremys mutica]